MQSPLHMNLMKEEPLTGHPTWEKICNLSNDSSSSFTQLARNKLTGDEVAIRFFHRGWDTATTVQRSKEILNHMDLSLHNHPHIVELKQTFITPQHLGLVMEFVSGETLETFLEKIGGKLIEGLARFIFQQLLVAVDFCHRKGKLLRDLRISNTLLSISPGQLPIVKLCDFQFSKDVQCDGDVHSQVGSALYAAPEVLQNACGGCYDGKVADLWSCGIILYVMIFGKHPFMRDQDRDLSQDQKMLITLRRTLRNDAEYPIEISQGISHDCLDILRLLIQVNPDTRASMHQIMAHPFFLETLPEGAKQMNDFFLADSPSLAHSDKSNLLSMVLRASTDDINCDPSSLPADQLEQLHKDVGLTTTHNVQMRRTWTASMDLEEELMSLPSDVLLAAATEDILKCVPVTLEDTPSIIAPRTASELERGLMVSSSFMKEFTQAERAGLLRNLPDHIDSASNALDAPNPSQHVVDASAFYVDSLDLPMSSFSLRHELLGASINWESFNVPFASTKPNGGSQSTLTSWGGAPPIGVDPDLLLVDSLWAQICKTPGHL